MSALGVAWTKVYGYLHSFRIVCVCSTKWVRLCMCLCSLYSKCECLCVREWTGARPHYCHSPHCLNERQRGTKAAAFNRVEKRWRQKAQIKQMPESGLESQLVVILFEWEKTSAGITHLGLSLGRPHKHTHPAFSSIIGPRTLGCRFLCVSVCYVWACVRQWAVVLHPLQLIFVLPPKHPHTWHLCKTDLLPLSWPLVPCPSSNGRRTELQSSLQLINRVTAFTEHCIWLFRCRSLVLCHLRLFTHGMCFCDCTRLRNKQHGGNDLQHVNTDLEHVNTVMLHVLLH